MRSGLIPKPGIRLRFGVRRQSEAATALWMRDRLSSALESGVALRLPPHSKTCGLATSLSLSEGLISRYRARRLLIDLRTKGIEDEEDF